MKSQFWLEQYHTTIDKRNTGYTEIVDKVPAAETMLYYFIYVISSHQYSLPMISSMHQCSLFLKPKGQTQSLVSTLHISIINYTYPIYT